MLLTFLGTALAAPAGYNVTVAAHDGCELSLGPAARDGVIPMHAECDWADTTIDKFRAVMGSWTRHADVFTVIVSSEVRRTEGERALVYQLQHTKGISDREVLMWMWHTMADGADRYAWTTAGDEPLTVQDGNVRCARSDGYWQAAANPAGGIHVVHQLEYAPGGSVPGFLVRWFQTSGLETNLSEVHAAVK